jgi:hypothetical protein
MKNKLAFVLVAMFVSAGLLLVVGNAVADTGTSTKAALSIEVYSYSFEVFRDINGTERGVHLSGKITPGKDKNGEKEMEKMGREGRKFFNSYCH